MILNFYRFSHDEIIFKKVLHVRQVVNINFVLFLYKTYMLIVDNWVLFVRIITFILSNKRFIQTIMSFSKFKDFSQTYLLPRSRKKLYWEKKKPFWMYTQIAVSFVPVSVCEIPGKNISECHVLNKEENRCLLTNTQIDKICKQHVLL